jgi:DNA-binding response OmpR family regulator
MASCGKPVVVVVEDDPGMRMVYFVNLEAEGYRVLEASSREDALSAVAENDVALMVFDGSLARPDDGLELGQQIRNERPEIALVIVSGRAAIAEERAFVDATFTKPFSLGEFVETVKRLAPV